MRCNQLIARFVDTLDRLSIQGIHIPGLIMSPPGVGKTSTLEMYAKYKDYNLVTLIASQYSSDDILGIQSVKDGILTRLAPSWYNRMMNLINSNHKRTILFIDEITTCDEFIQAPLLNLIFSKSLDEYRLPEDCIILSAGNYSEDLNQSFSMTSPLVNRFLILNLNLSDCSISDTINRTFRLVHSDEYEDFLGLSKYDPKYSSSKVLKWMNNLQFTESNITNNREEGLLGFCSIRSLTHCVDYVSEYFKQFIDDDWVRVVGDSLGKFKSGDDYLPIRNKLKSAVSYFLDNSTDAPKYDHLNKFRSILKNYEIMHDITELKSYVDSLDDADLPTISDLRELKKLCDASEDPSLDKLYDILNSRIDG